ncbi:hypothetical protein HYDPIDRAFT_152854 [Hydnomerulius pinastri MD-312]|uniref:Uncharacterized protein n=1 Tax=Hydnomerulius pinastri MD-312 TaxID=994086 RepID=A0A0C9WG91_9AGAM|nr:hypothetical protein HYDPIDRAFT_152854 [Hydnomerulius pinastri MD-312]
MDRFTDEGSYFVPGRMMPSLRLLGAVFAVCRSILYSVIIFLPAQCPSSSKLIYCFLVSSFTRRYFAFVLIGGFLRPTFLLYTCNCASPEKQLAQAMIGGPFLAH